MPVNFFHSLIHRPERGWDPLSGQYAERYGREAWKKPVELTVQRVEGLAGNLAGKRVLDLGAGAGQCSVAFAKRGAEVTWHDVSRKYETIAMDHAAASGVLLQFSLGYLEEAKKFGENYFDLVFCRLCWYYCRSDRAFAKLIYSLIKPNGFGYVECNTPAFAEPTGSRRLQYWLNQCLWWKIGHPMPAHGRIESLFERYPLAHLSTDYGSNLTDIVMFRKAMDKI
jgi:SAM-dependent methyltransferase